MRLGNRLFQARKKKRAFAGGCSGKIRCEPSNCIEMGK